MFKELNNIHSMSGKFIKKFLYVFLIVHSTLYILHSPVFAQTPHTYYVATTGNDTNPGTISQPFKTIQHGIDAMSGGDTVYIRGGVYNQPVKFSYKTNTSGLYLTLSSYNNEAVIIDGTNVPFNYDQEGLVYVKRSDNVRITGLTVQHADMAGIYVSYTNNTVIENNHTYDTVKSGISAWGATNIKIYGNDIALACNPHPNYPMSEENISLDHVDGFEVKNNYVHQAANIPDGASGGEGINLKDGCSNGTVHHNTVHLDERPDGKPSNRLAFGIDAWNSTDNTHDVEFYDNIAYNSGVGFIVSSEQGGTVDGVKLYNNIAYNNIRGGFAIPWWSGTKDGIKRNIQFINNVSYHNGYGFQNTSPKNENVLIRNNIFYQNTVAIDLLSGSESQFLLDHNLTSEDPRFVNPAGANFHLQAGSPAIDLGSASSAPTTDFDGIIRPQGTGFDIGAFEYTSTLSPTPTPTLKPGDSNGDQNVDIFDFVTWLSHYGKTATGPTYGDFDSNSFVDGKDYIIWLNNYGK
jgi:parallel beta-helix repeat protein